MANKFDLIWNL